MSDLKKRDRQIERAIGALIVGQTMSEAARAAGITVRTLNRWMADDEDVKDRITEARLQGDEAVVAALRDAALSGNVTAQIFWLKNRQPDSWRDRHDHSVKGDLHNQYEYTVVIPGLEEAASIGSSATSALSGADVDVERPN